MKKKVIVCISCLRASCIKGYDYCDNAENAGTTKKSIEYLEKAKLEDPKWWEDEC